MVVGLQKGKRNSRCGWGNSSGKQVQVGLRRGPAMLAVGFVDRNPTIDDIDAHIEANDTVLTEGGGCHAFFRSDGIVATKGEGMSPYIMQIVRFSRLSKRKHRQRRV